MLSRLLVMLQTVGALFKSHHQLALENLALLQQLAMLKPSMSRPRVWGIDRLFWVLFSTHVDGWCKMLHALHPDTVVRWHREGFRRYWCWKSRRSGPGRPPIDRVIRKLIREMQSANVGWGAPRIHGELLKLGIEISQATVSKYMSRHRKPPSQNWRTFLNNHVTDLASIDFFTVPTATFRVLYVLIILSHDRRKIVHFNATTNPTAQWTASRLWKRFRLTLHHDTYCEIGIASMVKSFNEESRVWILRKFSRRLDRPGKIRSWNG